MARLLVERETIFTEEVDMLMEGKSVEEIMAFMDENERTLRENPFGRGKKKSVIPQVDPAIEPVPEAPTRPVASDSKGVSAKNQDADGEKKEAPQDADGKQQTDQKNEQKSEK